MTMLSAKEVALKLDTDARTLRKFLRSEIKGQGGTIGVDSPGKGRRYSIDAKQVNGMKRRFTTWHAIQVKAREDARNAAKQAEGEEVLEGDEVPNEV